MMHHNVDSNKNQRLFSCVCQSQFVLVIQINNTVFDMLYRERIKKQRENLAKFILQCFPGVSKNYTMHRITSSMDYIFKLKAISKGEYVIHEGYDSNRLFIIKDGTCQIIKRIPRQNLKQNKNYKDCILSTIGQGNIFGDDKLLYQCPNRYSVKVSSIKCTIMSIKYSDYRQHYRRTFPAFEKLIKLRNQMCEQQLQKIIKNEQLSNMTNYDSHIWNWQTKPKMINWEQMPL